MCDNSSSNENWCCSPGQSATDTVKGGVVVALTFTTRTALAVIDCNMFNPVFAAFVGAGAAASGADSRVSRQGVEK